MFPISFSFNLLPSGRGPVWVWRWSWAKQGGCPDLRGAFALRETLVLAGWSDFGGGYAPDGLSFSLLFQPPQAVDAAAYVGEQAGNKIPVGSIVRLADGSEFRVERSNGFVISGFDEKQRKFAGVDLRVSRANIVHLAA